MDKLAHYYSSWIVYFQKQRYVRIKGGIKMTRRRGRKRKKLLDDLNERREYSDLKEKALDRTMWRTGFGRCFGNVMRQSTE
jgi:hypothetical protein